MMDLETDEVCIDHGDPIIAVDEENTKSFGCNKCVFERKLARPQFLTKAAKQIKERFDSLYNQLLRTLTEADILEPVVFQ